MDITTRNGVKTRVAKLNVQIDNLCQFLPQGFFFFFFFFFVCSVKLLQI